MKIWDRGTYELHKLRDDEVMVTFHGERVRGTLRAVPDRRQELDDPPHGPAGGPGPRADARADRADARAHRARCRRDDGAGRSRSSGTACARSATSTAAGCGSRAATATTSRRATPSCARSGRALGSHEAVLDGEVVALRRDGRPSFQRLQRRMHLTSERAVRRLLAVRARRLRDLRPALARRPLADGRCPTSERRERLRRARARRARRGRRPAHHVGDGAALLEASRAQGLEGIVAKRLDCPYVPGAPLAGLGEGQERPPHRRRDRRLAAGGEGGRAGPARRARGRLLRGRRAALRRQGRHGFTEAELTRLQARCSTPLARDDEPVRRAASRRRRRASSSRRSSRSVDYSRDGRRRGTLRQPSYKGLRDDIDPRRGRVAPEDG